ncbi:M91 family zinc metallopeptidase [Paraburkholderia sp. SIMBA_030]|uniref:M91 family zinc metallopeptidase n=1 Tax=Paraburkholderia sp. SIMBA_030 TaxID=3085773 RepID=UPI00397C4389
MRARQFRRISYWLLLSFVFMSGGQADDADRTGPARQRLRFTVTSAKPVYDTSERIILKLTITSSEAEEQTTVFPFGIFRDEKKERHPEKTREGDQVTVATVNGGTVSVVSATRGSEPLRPTVSPVRYVDDPVSIQIRSLKTIQSGDRVTIPFTVAHLPRQGSLLVTKQLHPGTGNLALMYPLKIPGLYTFRFAYHYSGPNDGHPNVFRGELLSNPVSFRLHTAKPEHGDGLVCDPLDPEFADTNCQPALEQVRTNGTPATQGLIESLESDTQHDFVIMRAESSSTYPTDPSGGATNGNGSGAIIEWNPTEGGTYLDGTPRDATSELPHEFYHAFIMQSGELGDTKAADNPSIFQDEVEATEIQNDYLRENGLPTIGKYCNTLENGTQACADVPASGVPASGVPGVPASGVVP